MGQENDRTARAREAAECGGQNGNGPAERIAAALKRLAGLLFPVPDGQLQPVPVRVRVRR